MDAELIRLRNQLHLYEMRRVRHEALAVRLSAAPTPVRPGDCARAAEKLRKRAASASGRRNHRPASGGRRDRLRANGGWRGMRDPAPVPLFRDSLYWSIITYTTIGYGDISPVTSVGKLLAAIHGIMGVLTTGVIAGLILNWLSPRTPQV